MNTTSTEMVVIIRPSFMKFCQDGCIAAAFNHALYWIAYKAKGQPKEKIQSGEITWYATTEEFTEGLASAWGVCKVRQSVNTMIDMGIIGRGCNTHWKVDRTKHFFFGKDQCATLLELCKKHDICLLHLGLHANVLQMINLSNASGTQLKCTCKQMINSSDASIDLSNANDDFIETIPKVSTKVTSKDINKDKGDSIAATTTEKKEPSPTPEKSSLNNKKEKETVSPEVLTLIKLWEVVEGGEYIPHTDKLIKSARALIPCKPSQCDLEEAKSFCYLDNPEWFKKHPPTLQDIANNWQKWKASKKVNTEITQSTGQLPNSTIQRSTRRSQRNDNYQEITEEQVQQAKTNNQAAREKMNQLLAAKQSATV